MKLKRNNVAERLYSVGYKIDAVESAGIKSKYQ